MSYLTTRPLALNLSHGGSPRLKYPFILPALSRVELVPDLDGLTGPGFVAGDTRQLAELSGNEHDAKHHYTRIPANAVAGDTDKERERVATLIAAEAGRARAAADKVGPPNAYLQAHIVTTEEGGAFLVVAYPDPGSVGAAGARAAVEPFGKPWDACAFPCSPHLWAMGPGVWPMTAPPRELSPFWVTGKDRQAGAQGVGEQFACAVWAHSESEARTAAIWRRHADGRENVEPFATVTEEPRGAMA